jgi:hypothetical protein
MEHNWLTSVTAIRAAAEILRDYDDLAAAERHRFLDAIVEESARLHSTFERLADPGSKRIVIGGNERDELMAVPPRHPAAAS